MKDYAVQVSSLTQDAPRIPCARFFLKSTPLHRNILRAKVGDYFEIEGPIDLIEKARARVLIDAVADNRRFVSRRLDDTVIGLWRIS